MRTVIFNAKEYTLTTEAVTTGRKLGSLYRDYHEAEEGDPFDFEMSASAFNEDGRKCTVYWIFSDTKGSEIPLDKHDYDAVDSVEYS